VLLIEKIEFILSYINMSADTTLLVATVDFPKFADFEKLSVTKATPSMEVIIYNRDPVVTIQISAKLKCEYEWEVGTPEVRIGEIESYHLHKKITSEYVCVRRKMKELKKEVVKQLRDQLDSILFDKKLCKQIYKYIYKHTYKNDV